MIVSVCDQDLVSVTHETEWMLQANVVAGAVNVAKLKQIAAGESLYCAAVDIDRTNDV